MAGAVVLGGAALSSSAALAPAASAAAPASTAAAISAGFDHTCALTSGSPSKRGAVRCWGDNAYGQLGNGTTNASFTPVGVSGLSSKVAAIAAGTHFSCALTTSGGVKCWGDNAQGQLGNGTTIASSVPVSVSGLSSGVVAITTGAYQACALTNGGGVKCWGDNNYGKLGSGTLADSSTPVDVVGLTSGVAAVSTQVWDTCALTTSGAVKCWGWNFYGQLGNGTLIDSSTPVDVSGLSSGVTSIAVGGYHACAILSGSGSVTCWGQGRYGQLGDGTATDSSTPLIVSGLSGATAVTGGTYHACAVTSSGSASCWGANNVGALGNGTATNSSVPVSVSGLYGAVGISGGRFHSCAVTGTGRALCWGGNIRGQLGNGSTTNSYTPVSVSGFVK